MEGGIGSGVFLGERERERATHRKGLKRKSSSLSSDSQGNQGLACKAYVVSGSFVRQVGL